MNVSLELMEFEITIFFFLKSHRFWTKICGFPFDQYSFFFYLQNLHVYDLSNRHNYDVFYNLFPALGSGLLLNMTKFEGETDVQVTCEAVGVAPEPRINITIDRFFLILLFFTS